MRKSTRIAAGLVTLTALLGLTAATSPALGTIKGVAALPGTPPTTLAHASDAQAATVGPATRTAASTTSGGFAMETVGGYGIYGTVPNGLRYYVKPHTTHASTIYSWEKTAISDLRSHGVNVTFAGYGTPTLTAGVVAVAEDTRGCQGNDGAGTTVLGVTYPYTYKLPNGKTPIVAADYIYICPKIWTMHAPSWVGPEIVRHETGHSVGLAHYNASYSGSAQTMHYLVTSAALYYRTGDVHGMNYIASHNKYIHDVLDPMGHFDSATRLSSTVTRLRAWGMTAQATSTTVYYQLIVNGKAIGYFQNNVLRSDVNAKYHVTGNHGLDVNWNSPSTPFTICIKAMTENQVGTGTSLGCMSVK